MMMYANPHHHVMHSSQSKGFREYSLYGVPPLSHRHSNLLNVSTAPLFITKHTITETSSTSINVFTFLLDFVIILN